MMALRPFYSVVPSVHRGRGGVLFALASILLLALLSAVGRSAEAAGSRFASLLIDVGSGRVLQQSNADLPRYPASLTKMMTLYLAFQALDESHWTLDEPLWVSAHAAAQAPTKLGLRPGNSIAVESAILALITKSANDAAVVLAENLAGSEDNFALRMTAKARALGMTETTFRNASGLPDPYQVTTARDMATLALALIYHYPQYYHLFATKYFYYNGRAHANHNHLLGVYNGVDGIKTGFTRASGYNLVASVQRDNRRLIGVVLGAPSSMVRNSIMSDLFDQAYSGASEIQVANLDCYLGSSTASADDDVASDDEAPAPSASSRRLGRDRSRTQAVAMGRGSSSGAVACSGSRSRRASCVAARGQAQPVTVARGRSQRVVAARQPASSRITPASSAAQRRATATAARARSAPIVVAEKTARSKATSVASRPASSARATSAAAKPKAATPARTGKVAKKGVEQTRLARR